MTLPKITYYTTHNRVNAKLLEIGDLTVWFSYKTPVAFQIEGFPRVISANYWGAATGAHLNAIEPDKSKRIDRAEFEARLQDVVSLINTGLEVSF